MDYELDRILEEGFEMSLWKTVLNVTIAEKKCSPNKSAATEIEAREDERRTLGDGDSALHADEAAVLLHR